MGPRLFIKQSCLFNLSEQIWWNKVVKVIQICFSSSMFCRDNLLLHLVVKRHLLVCSGGFTQFCIRRQVHYPRYGPCEHVPPHVWKSTETTVDDATQDDVGMRLLYVDCAVKSTLQLPFFLLPPIQRMAPSGEQNHGYATVCNGLTCGSVRSADKHPSNFRLLVVTIFIHKTLAKEYPLVGT